MDVTWPGFRHHQDQVIRFLPQVWPSIHRSLPSACCNLLQGVPVRVELWIAGLRIAAWHERVCTFFYFTSWVFFSSSTSPSLWIKVTFVRQSDGQCGTPPFIIQIAPPPPPHFGSEPQRGTTLDETRQRNHHRCEIQPNWQPKPGLMGGPFSRRERECGCAGIGLDTTRKSGTAMWKNSTLTAIGKSKRFVHIAIISPSP
ncbi:hypothetical protein CKAH01_17324 [Colletotrichum kahawae]|uniref:Uncharacterized protein n=1 Tax=Colletotrichum kahawae TaxID=34407 RepID=A0AAD9YD73_COLKA|nr:hypothetical protein CKAH01_17324 [Colletotrichum kahawae]